MTLYDRVAGLCWLVLFGTWIVLSIAGVRAPRAPRSPLRSLARLAIVLGVYLTVRWADRIPVPKFPRLPVEAAAAGAALCVLGLAFATWARLTLGRNWGMPMTQHERPELVTSGPYAYVRHPIYTGISAMWIGTCLVFPPLALPGVVFIAYFVFSALREDRDMARRFPDTHAAYRQGSKLLVPFVF